MQETRQYILEILRERGEATVDDIVYDLQAKRGAITAVTVRHHLNILQRDALVTSPQLKRRASPGRPQHTYTLTEKAKAHFPNNYQTLAASLLDELRKQLPPDGINVILEGVALKMADQASIPNAPINERLDLTVEYLTESGYEARWEVSEEGYLLHTSNCPYHNVAQNTPQLCEMDMRLVTTLLGIVPRRLMHRTEGDADCSYLIPMVTNAG